MTLMGHGPALGYLETPSFQIDAIMGDRKGFADIEAAWNVAGGSKPDSAVASVGAKDASYGY